MFCHMVRKINFIFYFLFFYLPNCESPLVNLAPWWSTMHLSELRCTLLSYATLLNYAAYCWALCCTLLSYPATYWHSQHPFFELRCTLWATLHPLSYAAPHWAFLYSNKLYHTLLSYTALSAELRCTLLSYPPPPHTVTSCAMLPPAELRYTFWTMLHLTESRGTLLSYTSSYWATL
jgi:hypothetical protein